MDTVYASTGNPDLFHRALALGGVVGPAVFVADWATLGLTRKGYSPVADAISRLAELGAHTRPAMTAGFIVDGLGIAAYGLAVRRSMPGSAWLFAAGSGIATLGVAAFPLGTPVSGKIHATVALIGYVALVGVPLATAPHLWRARRRGFAALSVTTGVVSAALLAGSLFNTPVHGLLQRTGLTVADAWLAASAIGVVRGTWPESNAASQASQRS